MFSTLCGQKPFSVEFFFVHEKFEKIKYVKLTLKIICRVETFSRRVSLSLEEKFVRDRLFPASLAPRNFHERTKSLKQRNLLVPE